MAKNKRFEKTVTAGWGDMDFNSHMRNTAYLDRSADVRMMFFAHNGFPMSEFVTRGLGPVVRKDEVEYFSEIGLLEEFRVSLSVAGLAENGSRFRLRNEFWRLDGKLAAKVTSTGGWLDLSNRKHVAAPQGLLTALTSLEKTDDYEILAPSVR